MSRSRKRPIVGVTCGGANRGEKKDKRIANRKLRRKIRQGEYDEVAPEIREVSDVWDFKKDGKVDWTGTDYEEKARRK